MQKLILITLALIIVGLGQALALSDLSQVEFSYSTTNHELTIQASYDSKVTWFQDGKLLEDSDHSIRVAESGVYTVNVKDRSSEQIRKSVYVDVQAGTVITIYIIGDSTVADYTTYVSNYEETRYPLMGWGQRFYELMVPDSLELIPDFQNVDEAEIDNRAVGGRSTKNFYEGGEWTPIHNALKAGDFVLIQFGHNDASEQHPDRYADTALYKQYLRTFVTQTREKGATPILITPVNRNYPWSGGKLNNVHGNYPEAMKEVATDLRVRLIDLTQRSIDFFSEKGESFVTDNYFLNLDPGEYPGYPDGNSDGTHFNEEGAYQVARLVFAGLQDLVSVSLSANVEAAGTIVGDGWYETKYSSTIELTATPNKGYKFVKWQGDTDSEENPLFLEPTQGSYEIEAIFEATSKPQYTLDYHIEGEGEIEVQPFGGLYEEGSNLTLASTPGEGFTLQSWFIGETTSQEADLTIENIQEDQFVYLYLADESYVQASSMAATMEGASLESSEPYFTGNGYLHMAQGSTASVSWTVNADKTGYPTILFRYQNKSDGDISAKVLVNGEATNTDLVFPPTNSEISNWILSPRHSGLVSEGANTLELKLESATADLNIDMMMLGGRNQYTIENITAIKDWDQKGKKFIDLVLFPNPIKHGNELTIEYELLDFSEDVSLYLLNQEGKIIYEHSKLEAQQGILKIPMRSYSPGIYFCQFRSGQSITTLKVVLN